MKKIPLTQGKFALVDDEDFEYLNQWKWCAHKDQSGLWTAIRRDGNKTAYMHRVLLSAPRGSEVDHENHNPLDNRRRNLRLCTRTQNMMNRRKVIGLSRSKGADSRPSKFKGVHWRKDSRKWRACIRVGGRLKSLGCYTTEAQAALAYDEAAKEHFGAFANTNF